MVTHRGCGSVDAGKIYMIVVILLDLCTNYVSNTVPMVWDITKWSIEPLHFLLSLDGGSGDKISSKR